VVRYLQLNPPLKNNEYWTKLKGDQGWKDRKGNIWKKDQKHKDHWYPSKIDHLSTGPKF
jgi:hypothetical protein